MALNIEYQLRPSFSNFSGGTIRLDDIRTIDIAALLQAGSGTIVVDSADGVLVGALDAYPALIRSGETEDPPLPIFSTTQLKVRGEGEKLLDLEGAAANMAVATDDNGGLVLVPFATPEEVALKADQADVDEALSSVVSGGVKNASGVVIPGAKFFLTLDANGEPDDIKIEVA
jgi:hypothetical protein